MALMDPSLVGPGTDNLGVADGEPLERLGHLHVELPCGFATANHISFGPDAAGHDHDVLLTEREPGSPITAIKGVQ
jgi:hypothetical protein